jgi:hypothetical protein
VAAVYASSGPIVVYDRFPAARFFLKGKELERAFEDALAAECAFFGIDAFYLNRSPSSSRIRNAVSCPMV